MPKTILIADDEQPVINAYARVLKNQGFQVISALTTEQAMETLERTHVDLLLLDLAIPTSNGLELLRKLRSDSRFAKLPVIVQSGFAERVSNELLPLHPVRVFTKPVPLDDLLWTIRDALDTKTRPLPH
ncbi:MAG TPA: response regulator [Bdellovibrionota bacterium]|nr:response regulator [Bdellovibrionota bacterium]